MDMSSYNAWLASLQTLAELATGTGLTAAAVRYFQARGIDTKKLLNAGLVSAAVNGAQALVLDLLVKGKSISDPAVLSDVTLALKTSLLGSHKETIAKLGATDTDVERIASNAIGGAVLPIAQPAAAVAAPSPVDGIKVAAQIVTDARAALAALVPPAPAPAPAPALATSISDANIGGAVAWAPGDHPKPAGVSV